MIKKVFQKRMKSMFHDSQAMQICGKPLGKPLGKPWANPGQTPFVSGQTPPGRVFEVPKSIVKYSTWRFMALRGDPTKCFLL